MNWILLFHADKNILEIIADGILTPRESVKLLGEIVEFNIVNHCPNILLDYRKITSVNSSIVDVYNTPKKLETAGVPYIVRIAILIPNGFDDIFSFSETVMRNKGFLATIFSDHAKAEKWLLSENR